jgi:hypothetical protein
VLLDGVAFAFLDRHLGFQALVERRHFWRRWRDGGQGLQIASLLRESGQGSECQKNRYEEGR